MVRHRLSTCRKLFQSASVIKAPSDTLPLSVIPLPKVLACTTAGDVANVEQKRYQYDLNSNVTQYITANGAKIEYSYDSLNQLIKVSSSDGDNVEYSYDSEGRITK
ncbi:hypothetical protein BMR08_18565, partial [Methylococcaceae bacterium CS2]